MVRLIKNLKASGNEEMVKGCMIDACSVYDGAGGCSYADLCGIDGAICYNIDVCYTEDSAGFCYQEDECHVDTLDCYAAYDYSGL